MRLPQQLYGLYERQLVRTLPREALPRHIGVILDGNRRWARTFGESTATGHQRGAEKITEFLGWSEEIGTEVVTLWMLSTDNLTRDPEELEALLAIIVSAVEGLAACGRWRLRIMGRLDLLPADVATTLREAEARTEGNTGLHVNVAIGYGGRHEIADAVRDYLRDAPKQGSRSPRWPTSSTSRTSPRTSTRAASPTRTSSSARRASSASRASSCGSPRTPSTTSARPTGRASVASTSCVRCAPTSRATGASGADRHGVTTNAPRAPRSASDMACVTNG